MSFTVGWFSAKLLPTSLLKLREDPVLVIDLTRGGGGATSRQENLNYKKEALPVAHEKTSLEVISISKVVAGSEQSTKDEYIDLFNSNDYGIFLDGWSIKKVSASGEESTLVTSKRFNGISIPPHGTIRAANADAAVEAIIRWPASYGISNENNGIVLYRPDGTVSDAVRWATLE